MWLWRVRMKVVYRWKLSIDENCQLKKVVCWWKLSFDESCLLMKVFYWRKWSIDESCLIVESCILMKVAYCWKLSIDESLNCLRSDSLWRFACGDVFVNSRYSQCESLTSRVVSPSDWYLLRKTILHFSINQTIFLYLIKCIPSIQSTWFEWHEKDEFLHQVDKLSFTMDTMLVWRKVEGNCFSKLSQCCHNVGM